MCACCVSHQRAACRTMNQCDIIDTFAIFPWFQCVIFPWFQCVSLDLADIPAASEPVQKDSKGVDGVTLIPWSRGIVMVWDATCSSIFRTKKENMALKKCIKIPFAVGTELPFHSLCDRDNG